jgi:hypothetical protein
MRKMDGVILGVLLTTHEHFVQIVHAQLEPGRATMIALTGALGLFHFTQQGIHFGDTQDAIRAHGTVTGERGE